jgi:hypothetical protein
MLATRSDLFIPTTVDAPYHALVCRQVLFSLDDITMPLPHAITNLLQEFKDIFPARDTPGITTFDRNWASNRLDPGSDVAKPSGI